jgi:hypothetical protein
MDAFYYSYLPALHMLQKRANYLPFIIGRWLFYAQAKTQKFYILARWLQADSRPAYRRAKG